MLEYLIAYGIFLMAIMSPGPDVAATLQNALVSRRHGLATALGIALGNIVHIGLAATVLGVFLTTYSAAFTAMQLFAGGYLLYLAYKSWVAPATDPGLPGDPGSGSSSSSSSGTKPVAASLREGVLICLANPKAIMFWLSFFSATVAKLGSGIGRLLFIAALFLTLLAWFSLVAVFFSTPRIRQRFLAFERTINIVVAVLFALLGVGLLWSVLWSVL